MISIKDIQHVYDAIIKPNDFFKEATVDEIDNSVFGISSNLKLYFKNEGTQITGSFKIRGIINQFANISPDIGTNERQLVTISAGNYGKSFATMCQAKNLKGRVLLPDTAPSNRQQIIQDLGVDTELHPSCELLTKLDECITSRNMIYMGSFDDLELIKGYASIGLEIVKAVPDVDIILVCCGGGGLISGIASAVKLGGASQCKIYGVEPKGANTMWESFKAGHAVTNLNAKSVAAGLAPPCAGKLTYALCREFVDDILLVSDDEILYAAALLNSKGYRIEPSGAAAMAALLAGIVPQLDVKGTPSVDKRPLNVVVMLTGSNLGPDDETKLADILAGPSVFN